MDATEVTELVKEALPGCDVQVQVDGTHYMVVVVGDVFEGLPTIKRQQLINKALFQNTPRRKKAVRQNTLPRKSMDNSHHSALWRTCNSTPCRS